MSARPGALRALDGDARADTRPGPGEQRIVAALPFGVVIAVSFLAAELSYRYVELPALRVKRRFQGGAHGST